MLWVGNVEDAKNYIRKLDDKLLKNKGKAEEMVAYLERKKDFIPCYAMRKALALRNSSNPVEKANDICVAKRQKHNGMSWSPNGSVHSGRPVEEVGAHCLGHNANSIGIAYVGGLDADGHPADTRTEAQCLALLQLVRDLMEEHPITSIHGHNEFSNRACPCFDVQQWRRENNL